MAIVNCPECNEKISNEAKVCPHCGVSLRHCKECGSAVLSHLKTCPCCGAPIQPIRVSVKNVRQSSGRYRNIKDFICRNKVAIVIAVIVIIVIGAIIGFSMYHGQTTNSKNSTSNIEDAVSLDTVDTAEVSYDIDEYDAITYVGDGATFDVMGKVKEISDSEGRTLWEFSNDMKFVPSEAGKVRRNSKDQIEIYIYEDGGGFTRKYEYNSLGRILREHTDNDISKYLYHKDLAFVEADDIILDYKYDADNYVSAIDLTIKYDQGNYMEFTNPKTFKTHLDVKVLEKDNKGNWTKRRIQGEVVILSDEGTDEAGRYCGEELRYYCKKKVDYTEQRYIDYYEEY